MRPLSQLTFPLPLMLKGNEDLLQELQFTVPQKKIQSFIVQVKVCI